MDRLRRFIDVAAARRLASLQRSIEVDLGISQNHEVASGHMDSVDGRNEAAPVAWARVSVF
jgi:hypothetical protein